MRPAPWAALAALAAWFAIYLPDAGRGFIKDDFAWLLAAPLSGDPWREAWTASTGFFRPLVSLSFTANHALLDLNPLGYGMTNVALALACAAAIFMLARAWGLGEHGALVASGLWLFTPHGMDMAVIWISGRSALLLVLFATLCCWSAARGRLVAAVALAALALLSKDEAVTVPALAVMSMVAAGRGRERWRIAAWIAGSAFLVAAYFWMRTASGAMTPWSAPAEYRPALDPSRLAANALQYADRLLTLPLAVGLVAWIAAGMPRPRGLNRRAIALGLLWASAAMTPTIALPVRSSLYVLLPLAGCAIAAGAVIEAILRSAVPRRVSSATLALLALAAVAVPVYRARQHEWSEAARLSSRLTAEFRAALAGVPEGARVGVQDRHAEPNLESTFGDLLPEMLLVTTGKRFEVVRSPQRGASILLAPVPR